MRIIPVLALMLASSASAYLDNWFDTDNPLVEHDSAEAHTVRDDADYTARFVVASRDASGRPKRITSTSTDSWTMTLEYTWGDGAYPCPYLVGTRSCPERLVRSYARDTGIVLLDTNSFSWRPDSRSIIAFSSWERSVWCPWQDSLVYDTHSRLIEHHSCGIAILHNTGSDQEDTTADKTVRRFHFDDANATHPRSIAQESGTLIRTHDSILVIGSVDLPLRAECFTSYDSMHHTSIGYDSIRRDGEGRLLSVLHRYDNGSGTFHNDRSVLYTWTGNVIASRVELSWSADTIRSTNTTIYAYSWSGTGAGRRAPHASPRLRRLSDGRLALDIGSGAPPSLAWIGVDGRVVPLPGQLSGTGLEFAAPKGPGFLRIDQGGRFATLRVPPL